MVIYAVIYRNLVYYFGSSFSNLFKQFNFNLLVRAPDWSCITIKQGGVEVDFFAAGMKSRSRGLGLETVSRPTDVSSRSRLGHISERLGLVSVSGLGVSDLVSVSASKVSLKVYIKVVL